MLKRILKEILPPFLYEALRRIFYKKKYRFTPSWHVIKEGPLKGRQIFIDPKAGQWQKEMLDGIYDLFLFEYLEKQNLQGKIIFDIGAHIGFHTMNFASLVGDEGCVYAFEPNVINLERMTIILDKNPDLSKRIKIYDIAISDTTGKEEFYFCKNVDRGASSGSFISKAHTYYPKSEEYIALFEKTKVKTISLDHISSLLGKNVIPHVIKIDVEGSESSVLKGAVEMLFKYRPLVLVEVHSIYNMLKTYEILKSAYCNVILLKEEPDGRCHIAAEP